MKVQFEKYKNIFSILIIGEGLGDLYLWKRHGLIVYSIDSPRQLSTISSSIDLSEIDIVFLGTPVTWQSSQEGLYDTNHLEQDLLVLRENGCFQHNIFLSHIMPIGVADRLHCHYCPLLPMIPERRVVGYNTKILMDMMLFREIFTTLLDQYIIKSNHDAEMICLIDTCQAWINTSFQREISLFCPKVSHEFSRNPSSGYLRRELYPILVYMIRQIEDSKLDCPLLYSCLFRHNYIDIHI